MSVVLPWQKREFILAAEANLVAAFAQHRERMIVHLAQRLGMAPEEVREVMAAGPLLGPPPPPEPPPPPPKPEPFPDLPPLSERPRIPAPTTRRTL